MAHNTDSKVESDQEDVDSDRRDHIIIIGSILAVPILELFKTDKSYTGRIVVDSSKSDYIESVDVSVNIDMANLTVNLNGSKNISALVVNMNGKQYDYGVVGSGQSVVELDVRAEDISDNKMELLVVSGGRIESTGGWGSESYYTGGDVLEKIPITMEDNTSTSKNE